MSAESTERTELLPTRLTLLERLKDLDDQDSWKDFFSTYSGLIYGVAVKAGLTDSEAQEALQETIISVARKMEGFNYDPAKGSFKAWLLRLTRWRITDQLRRRKHQGVALDPVTEGTGPAAMESFADPQGPVLDRIWDEEWTRSIMDAALAKVKGRINPKHFQIFDLLVMNQWPVRRVASTLGVGVARIYLVKHRVAALLKEIKQIEAGWREGRDGKP